MKRLSLYLANLCLMAMLAVPFVFAAPVSAQGCVKTAFFGCVQENKTSTALNDNPIYVLLLEALKFLGYGVGIVVVGGITYGAFLIVNSNANAGRTQEGVSMIVNAFIGLLLYIFLFAIANYLVPGGIFT